MQGDELKELEKKIDRIKSLDKPASKIAREIKNLTNAYCKIFMKLGEREWIKLNIIILCAFEIDKAYFKSAFILWGN